MGDGVIAAWLWKITDFGENVNMSFLVVRLMPKYGTSGTTAGRVLQMGRASCNTIRGKCPTGDNFTPFQ
jgi:hypothetical protein